MHLIIKYHSAKFCLHCTFDSLREKWQCSIFALDLLPLTFSQSQFEMGFEAPCHKVTLYQNLVTVALIVSEKNGSFLF